MGEVGAPFLHGRFNAVIVFRCVRAAGFGAENRGAVWHPPLQMERSRFKDQPLLEFVNWRDF